MPKKWKICTKNRNKLIFAFFLILLPFKGQSANGEMPIDDREIRLPDGRKILAKRAGIHSHYIILKDAKKVLWKRWYEQQYDRLWDYAFFVPVKNGHYNFDVNSDGYPEIAIATWDGGNNIADRDVLIFTVRKNSLVYLCRRKFNLEYGENAYP